MLIQLIFTFITLTSDMNPQNQSTTQSDAEAILQHACEISTSLQSLQESNQTRQSMEDVLITLVNNSHIGIYNNPSTIDLPPPYNQSESRSDDPTPFSSPMPVFFHISVDSHPMEGRIGTFCVITHPKSTDGRACLIECGQTVVMAPNHTVAWYLDCFDDQTSTITYTATNDRAGVIRYLVVQKEWTSEGQIIEEEEEEDEEAEEDE